METSFLEKKNQKQLYTILYLLKQNLSGRKILHSEINDNEVLESFDNAAKLVFQIERKKLDYIDLDFMMNLYILNFDKINTPKDFVELTIPQAKEYKFDVQIEEVQTLIMVYEQKLSSYSKKGVRPMIILLENEGELDVFGGREMSREVVDGSVEEIKIIYNSITEVSPEK